MSVGSRKRALGQLRAARRNQLERADELERRTHECVLAAREAGATWPEIADAMEISRQGVHLFMRKHERRAARNEA